MNQLTEYNKSKYQKLKPTYKYLQLGFFNGDKILFIGQNPGMPFNQTTKEITNKVIEEQDYDKHEEMYRRMIINSKIGQYIGKAIDHQWSKISFTNIVKIPTENNEQPSPDLVTIFMPITRNQIALLHPHLIVCLGRFAADQFNLTYMNQKTYIAIPIVAVQHPAYFMKQNNELGGIRQLKQIVQQYL